MQIKNLIVDNQISAKTIFLNNNYNLSTNNDTLLLTNIQKNKSHQFIHDNNWKDLIPLASTKQLGLMNSLDKEKLDIISAFFDTTDKHQISNLQKLILFIDAIKVDKYPEEIKGFEYIPYFDKKNMKFSWKPIYKPEA